MVLLISLLVELKDLLKGNKVDIVKEKHTSLMRNTVRVMDEDSSQTYTFKNAIIATGSRPIEIPTFKYLKTSN